jgi:O-antigen/teichoic acid export membrane protein
VTIPFSILLSASLFFFSDLIAVDIFHDASYKEALELVAIIVPFYALLNINIELIRGMKKLHISEFLRNVNRPLINVVLLFIIGMYVTDKLLPIYTLGAGIALGFIFSVAFIFKNITKSLNRKVVKKEILTTSFPMFLSTLSGFLIGAIPLFILQIFTTSSEVGVFSVAYKLSLIVGISLMILNTILAPKISELFWADDHKNLQAVISRSVRIIFYVSLFTAVVIMTFNKQILNVFGDEFLGGEIALGLMIIGQVFNVATGSVGIFMNMTGNQRVLMNVAIMVTFFSFLVSYIVVPKYGINGAALVSMISTILINAIPAYYAKLRLNYIVYYVPRFFIKK